MIRVSIHQLKRMPEGTAVVMKTGGKERKCRLVQYGGFGKRLQDQQRTNLYLAIRQLEGVEYLVEE